MVVGDEDRPAALARRPRDRDVAAEIDEDAGAGRPVRGLGSPVCGQCLRGRTEVDRDPGGDADPPPLVVDLDPPPARRRDCRDLGRLAAGDDDREVAVPAKRVQRGAHGRVDVTAGGGRRADASVERLPQQRTRSNPAAAGVAQAHHLGVGPEAAAGLVDRPQLVEEEVEGLREQGGLGHDQLRRRAERVQAGGAVRSDLDGVHGPHSSRRF